MTTFVYGKVRHRRTETPPQLTHYAEYKPFVRREFGRACVYCRWPDTTARAPHFAVEHYRPKDKFPWLAVEYSNLFYACSSCNSRKGSYWPAPHQLQDRAIPNPCEHVMWEHLRFNGATVEARSPLGRFALKRLDLNDPAAVSTRTLLIDAFESFSHRLGQARRELKQIDRDAASGALAPAKADSARARLGEMIALLEGHIARLTAKVPVPGSS